CPAPQLVVGNGQFTDIGFGAGEQLNDDGHGAGLDDHLGLSGGAQGDVGEGPGGLELDDGMGGPKELDKTAHDAGLDDLLDGRAALLAKQLAELGCGLDLEVDLVRKDAGDHLGEVLIELCTVTLTSGMSASTD